MLMGPPKGNFPCWIFGTALPPAGCVRQGQQGAVQPDVGNPRGSEPRSRACTPRIFVVSSLALVASWGWCPREGCARQLLQSADCKTTEAESGELRLLSHFADDCVAGGCAPRRSGPFARAGGLVDHDSCGHSTHRCECVTRSNAFDLASSRYGNQEHRWLSGSRPCLARCAGI